MAKKTTLSELRALVKQTIRENVESLKEIAPETFKKAVDASTTRGNIKRTEYIGGLYFNKFIGKPLFEGEVRGITIETNPLIVAIDIKYPQDHFLHYQGAKDWSKHLYDQHFPKTVFYDLARDVFFYYHSETKKSLQFPMKRKDARLLSLIAQHVNPDSRYKESLRHFEIEY